MGSHANHQENRAEARPGGTWQREQFSTLEEMNGFLARFTTWLASCGFGEKDIFGVRLSLEEAIVNAIRHGHKLDANKRVHITFAIDPQQVVVEVKDEGPGFDPAKVPDPLAPENLGRPGGRGVFLMHAYMSSIRYNETGNSVTLCKVRSA